MKASLIQFALQQDGIKTYAIHRFLKSRYHLIIATFLSIGVATSSAQGLKNVIPQNQAPILRVIPPAPAEQSEPGTGKFVIFTREKVGKDSDYIAGAWECIPSRPEAPLTKRIEFCLSSSNADALHRRGMHPRFVQLMVENGDGDHSVNLYDINYRTWEVRCLWQGKRLRAFGAIDNSIFCETSDGWLLLDAASATFSRSVPFIPIETDGNYWLVRKPTETEGCWSYDPVREEFIAHFGPVKLPQTGASRSRLSPDGKSRAWVLAAMPKGWRGGNIEGRLLLQRLLKPQPYGSGCPLGTIDGSLILQRQSETGDISVAVEMQAKTGSGVPVIPLGTKLEFSNDGQVEFRARRERNRNQDQVWSIDIESGKVSSEMKPHMAVAGDEHAVLDGVPVPDYLRSHVGKFSHFGRTGLAPAFLMHLGILKEPPEYPDCTAGVSRDGRHVLYTAKKGPLSGFYIYGDLLTQQTVRWSSPDALNDRYAQDFVWVETPN